jgi:hypothetical protein
MDSLCHALIGFATGRSSAAVLFALAPDVPAVAADVVQLAVGDLTFSDILRGSRPRTSRRPVLALLWLGRLAHSAAVGALLLPVTGQWLLHLVVDWATHRESLPMFPLCVELHSPLSWQELPAAWRLLAWIPLLAICCY